MTSSPNPQTEAECAALDGRWEDHWDPKHAPPQRVGPDGGIEALKTGWQVIGRGNRRYRGCNELPAPDVGRACRFPFDCLGGCENGVCSARIQVDDGIGCGPRCIEGRLDTQCWE